MKPLKILMTALAAFIAWSPSVRALNDYPGDTVIYVGSGRTTGTALVMLVLDFRPNLTSTVCNGTECDFLKASGNPEGVNYIGSTPTDFLHLLVAVLKKVFNDVAPKVTNPEALKIGLMMNHQDTTGGQCGGGPIKKPSVPAEGDQVCSNGGYIVLGFKDFNTIKAGALENKLLSVPLISQGNVAHPYQGKELYFELFRYLTGQNVHNGHDGWDDYAVKSENLDVRTAPTNGANLSWDTSIETPSPGGWWRYISPLTADCSKVFVINFMFAVSQQESESDTAIKATRANGGMGFDPKGDQKATSRVVGWLYNADLADGANGTTDLADKQNVTSYFFVGDNQDTQANNAEYALQGGTGSAIPILSKGKTVKDLYDQIGSVFNEILRVSTTFVSASVPVNVINRSETKESVYFALFEPESKPQWPGNVKRLKLAVDPDSHALLVQDANGDEAISPIDGKIKDSALTFWTNKDAFDVQAFDTDKSEVQGKDGRSVNRGGCGQRIPGFLNSTGSSYGTPSETNGTTGGRTLYTEPGTVTNGTPTTMMAFNADATTAQTLWPDIRGSMGLSGVAWTSLTATQQADAVKLLKFARGIDVKDDNLNGSTTDARPWMMGDLLHSQPIPINYGARTGYSVDNPDIRILVSGDDGVVHMIQNNDTSGNPLGVENWGFIPRATLEIQKRLYDNAAATRHPYGVDGPAAVYIRDANGDGVINSTTTGDRAIAIFGLRRGGRAFYALDLTDPDSPKLLWRIDPTVSGFGEMGLAFSRPWIATMKWDSDPATSPKPVAIFGGGYDPNKDRSDLSFAPGTSFPTGTDDTIGNAVYIVDLATGNLVWKAVKGTSTGNVSATVFSHTGLADSIPSQVAVIDSDGDFLADILYVGDTGGRVWRGDFPGTDTTKWRIYPLLNAGRHDSKPDRWFFHRPDVARGSDDAGSYFAVLIGSGDRPHPLRTDVTNQFYMVKDRNAKLVVPTTGPVTSPPAAFTLSSLADVTSNCLGAYPTPTCSTTPNLANGWYINLTIEGEKSLASPLTLFGDVYFSTFSPKGTSSSVCTPDEGTGYTYVVNLKDGTGALDLNASVAGLERYTKSGEGIPSDPIIVNLDPPGVPGGPFLYVVPSNVGTDPVFRKTMQDRGTDVPPGAERFFGGGLRVLWYDKGF